MPGKKIKEISELDLRLRALRMYTSRRAEPFFNEETLKAAQQWGFSPHQLSILRSNDVQPLKAEAPNQAMLTRRKFLQVCSYQTNKV